MFEGQDFVCELKTTMRFRGDPVLMSILSKMRTPGEDRSKLRHTEEEWRILQSTDIAHGAYLERTDLWYQSAFAWSYVCVAQWDNSLHSTKFREETLFRNLIKNPSGGPASMMSLIAVVRPIERNCFSDCTRDNAM